MKTIIIAEAGVNHNGSVDLAKKMIDVACNVGVDYIKFQLGIPELLVTNSAPKAEYQMANTGNGGSQLDMIKKISLSFQDHKKLMEYCKAQNISYLCTPFDLISIDFLAGEGMKLWKIPSGEITNYPYLVKIGHFNQPTILSTGMCTLNDIAEAIKVLKNNGLENKNISILHCNTEYPTPMEDVNLNAMKTIADKFGVKVGYSDHTKGIEVPIAAVALGACVIEKHFTLDRNMDGPDHKASLEPNELKSMVTSIRNVELALGTEIKKVSPSEEKNKAIARKSIVAATQIHEGEIFTENNLTVKRPGTGISPMLWESLLGQKAQKFYNADDLIEL